MADAPDLVVVANPAAGHGKAGRLIGKVTTTLHRLQVPHEIRVSESGADLERQARVAAEAGTRIVAALGGDGTASLAANGILGTGAALAALPAGTGDDFAKAIGAGKLDAAIELLAHPKTADLDVIEVTTGAAKRSFINIAGAGFDSEVNETANGMTVKLGATGTYIVALLKTLSRYSPAAFTIQVDDERMELTAMLVEVGSGRWTGGGMKVLPNAVMNDGVLDVCVVEALSKLAFMRAFPRVFLGSHTTHPKVRMRTGTRVQVEANRRVLVYADGELVGSLPAIFEVRPAALPVVVGPDAKGVR
ncbi:MAG: diacylglycerol kinase family lipid kinase [Actinomycetota bacterium]|nr:diacylglycerol kinase family lipid kinase [Actinomycetota bacterium]